MSIEAQKSPANLPLIQQHWQEWLLQQHAESLAASVAGPAGVDTQVALTAYRNNHIQNLIAVLEQTFPVCCDIVGEDCFRQLCQQYIQQNPIQTRALEKYGKSFSEFLSHVTGMREHTPYLPDMAQMEFLKHTAYYAKNRSPFDFLKFESAFETKSDKIAFTLAADVHLLHSPWPLHKLLEPEFSGLTSNTTFYYIIERPQYQVKVNPIGVDLFQYLTHIVHRKTFLTLSETTPNVDTLTRDSIIQGWIGGFYVSE